MKFDGKLLLFGLPLVAIVVIALIQTKYGDLAPAPPMSIPDRTMQHVMPRAREPQPTVLAPSAEPNPLPPGSTPAPVNRGALQIPDELSIDPLPLNDPIPIPELWPNANPDA